MPRTLISRGGGAETGVGRNRSRRGRSRSRSRLDGAALPGPEPSRRRDQRQCHHGEDRPCRPRSPAPGTDLDLGLRGGKSPVERHSELQDGRVAIIGILLAAHEGARCPRPGRARGPTATAA